MYHGVTINHYSPSVWTQLPVNVFEKQILWLAKYYHPVSLTEVVDAITHGRALPPNSVLVTFDDGLKNNATVAYPILKKYKVPAAIFLTVDFVGTDSFFWVDELWLIIKEAGERQIAVQFNTQNANLYFGQGKYWDAYHAEVEYLKRRPEEKRLGEIAAILAQVKYDKARYQGDFGTLAWQEIIAMDREGLIEFGTHTATHRILTSIPANQLEDELFGAKDRLERQLGHRVDAFCYPNGRFGKDYLPEHREILCKGGYKCAFTTDLGLCDLERGNVFSIPRVSVANDVLSDSYFFQMNASGLCEFRKKYIQGIRQ
jgi:peptidoglycan/xylan/chitin deacetylase (PgdA/CDA1 family)